MAVARQVAPANPTVNLFDWSMYTSGGGLPDGDYALTFDVVMHQPKDRTTQANKGPAKLGVMVTAYPLSAADPASEAREQFYSMGSKAHEAFVPSESGKGIVPVAGGVGGTLNQSTNWAMLIKSMLDCDPAVADLASDLSGLDGVHVHLTNVPEPEERKGFRQTAATGEAGDVPQRNSTVGIVTEIKDGGKPWEGGGGIPEAGAKPAAAPAKKSPVPIKAAGKKAPAAPPPPAESDDETLTAALNGVTTVLEKNPNGCSKLVLKTSTFKAVSESGGAEMAQAVMTTFFATDDALNGLLGQLGYAASGPMVKPQ